MGLLLDALNLKAKSPGGGAPGGAAKSGAATAAIASTVGAKGAIAASTPADLVTPNPAVQAGSGPAPPPAVDKNQAAYAVVRDAVQKLVDGLNAHAQKAKIAAQIGQATTKLGDAATHAGKKEWAEATKALADAKAIYAAAKKLADDWAAYAAKRGDALALAMANNSADTPKLMPAVNAVLAQADALANAAPPNFAAAQTLLKQIPDIFKPQIVNLIKTVKARLATVEKSDKKVKAFAQAEIDKGKPLIAAADAAFAASQWSVCMTNAISALRVLGPAVRMCEGRALYEKQREIAAGSVAKVKAAAAVKDRAAALDTFVAQADALAAYETRKFEEGARVLQDAAKRADVWTALAGTVASYVKDRAAAEADLAALDKHAAAAKIGAEREAVRKLLADAKGLAAGADAAADPTPGWNAALTAVTRAKADLGAAQKLADGLGPASAAEAAAAKPGDAAALKAALDKLRADGKNASKAAYAAQAAAEFKRFDERAAAAEQALAAKDAAKAAPAVADAAKAIVAAKSIQAEHAQFASTLGSVESQLKKLQASPRAAAIKGRIDSVATALADAKAKDQAHVGPAAMVALRQANDAVAAATGADRERATFDTNAAAMVKRIDATKDATEKTALQKSSADATKLADAFSFADAGKELKKIEVRLDKAALEAVMKTKPGDPKIPAMAAKMVENGGEATVDKMIQDVPDGGDARLVNALAQGRYGVKFSTGTPLAAIPPQPGLPAGIPAGDEAKAMKAVCAMFSKIPQDVRKNRSITGVSHEDAIGRAGGGHNFDDAKISMLGRPGTIQQQFGAAQQNTDPKTGNPVNQLPAAIDENCKPVNNNPVEYLAFAAAHEVGHGVDDARGFMAQNGNAEKHGGWITYASSLQPLADIVGADARFADFYKTPEQRQYVLEKLLSKPATPPAVPIGSAADNARKAFDLWHSIATSPNVYRRQSDCDAIKIGDRVYHEAYARNWVSYLAAARAKALTGYQFRAPGEWFAELYAGYRSGKLKPDHPAMEWLKKL